VEGKILTAKLPKPMWALKKRLPRLLLVIYMLKAGLTSRDDAKQIPTYHRSKQALIEEKAEPEGTLILL